jgi:light-regulated signal transduction histidine kinase (bacteriophytochrome)
VNQNAQDMGKLIDGLLAFSRLGQQALAKRPVKAGAVAREALGELRPELEGRAVEVSVGDLPTVEADRTLLKQVFVNLLANALKYTRGREPARIEIGSYEDGPERVLFVRDNGVGFDMRYVGKLFQVFQRLHRVEDFEGTGLGLALVARIVKRHGGRIWAEGKPDEGASFYFTLKGARDGRG